jgi:hypothetical protein
VQLEQVVRRRDEPPCRPACRSATALEASEVAVELQLAEDRLDRRLTLAIELAAVRGRERVA